ncbi:MAG: DnaJ domain-containing protein [Burkholderiales bacterium]
MKKTLYQILGVEPNASEAEIAAAYAKRMRELKVETMQDPNKLVVVQQAKEILLDPTQRAGYDASIALPLAPASSPIEPVSEAASDLGWVKWGVAGAIVLGVGVWWATSGETPTPVVVPKQSARPVQPAPEVSPVAEPAPPSTSASEPASNVSPAVTPSAQEEATTSPLVGAWSCLDPVSGRTDRYDFQPDATVNIESAEGRSSAKYEMSGLDLKLTGPNLTGTYLIEELSGKKMVLNTGGQGRRLVCTR